MAFRNADTGAIERHLQGLHKAVEGLLLTRDHLWAGGDDRRLIRWPLAAGTNPDLPPIEEGSPISDLAATPDGRFLIAALEDGRAAVRTLPDGTLIAHLIPLRDGSWATIHADGHYEASQGDALALRFEDPSTRKAITLGHLPDPLAFGKVSTTRLPDGPLRIRTTVFSAHGPPKVRLDDRWPITAITPSPTSVTAYDIDFILDDFTETPHTLDASAEGGAPGHVSFTPPPPVRNGPAHPRALLIANGTYATSPLPGALKDADDLAKALASPESWALDGDHLAHPTNLPAKAMEDTVKTFFREARPDETLLFYYAGHGDSEGSEGFLIPIDDPPKPPHRRISASSLWSWIETSKAAQIVVILDACRAGAFLLPDSITRKAEARRVLFLTSTSAGAAAKDTRQGGPFTQALVEALKSEERIDPFFHAVTTYKAFLHAADLATDQHPRLFGNEKLDSIALSWPRPAGSRQNATPIAVNHPSSGALLADVQASLVTDRQIAATPGEVQGGKLEVRVLFGEEAEWLHVALYYPDTATDRPRRELFSQNTTGPRWRKGQRVTVPVSLDELTSGTYRVEVEACGAKDPCGQQGAAAKFPLKL